MESLLRGGCRRYPANSDWLGQDRGKRHAAHLCLPLHDAQATRGPLGVLTMGETLKYLEADRSHQNDADTLGQLQGGVVKGTITDKTPNAYYIGVELLAEFPMAKPPGFKFLKKDCTGSGTGKSDRSKNRIVVLVDASGQLVEGEGWLWRHDNRVLKLSPGFFVRAQFLRSLV
jgi:hypothetical protein